jgi:hypothetical protein
MIVVFLGACWTTGRRIDQGNIDRVQIGKTTKEEVLRVLGPPDQVMRSGSGETTMMYNYYRMQMQPSNFIPIVGPFIGGTNTQNQMVMVIVGSDGIVRDITTSEGGMEMRRGLNK